MNVCHIVSHPSSRCVGGWQQDPCACVSVLRFKGPTARQMSLGRATHSSEWKTPLPLSRRKQALPAAAESWNFSFVNLHTNIEPMFCLNCVNVYLPLVIIQRLFLCCWGFVFVFLSLCAQMSIQTVIFVFYNKDFLLDSKYPKCSATKKNSALL